MTRSYPVQPSQAVLDKYVRDRLRLSPEFPLNLEDWQLVQYLRQWQTSEQARQQFEAQQSLKLPTAADMMSGNYS